MLITVISGAQIGVDIAALIAAKEIGLQTGGYIPIGYRTKKGNKPEYREKYNLRTTMTTDYSPRTEYNVRDSDGTLRIAHDFLSAGEICTFNAIKKHRKPFLDIWYLKDISIAGHNIDPFFYHDIHLVWYWLEYHKIKTLNVAGNGDESMEEKTIEFLKKVFERYAPTRSN